jgi:hypothetical protein
MSAPSAARVRSRFMSFGLWASAVAFVVIEGDALLDQSEIGHASIQFMLGTACLAAAGCLALFAFISVIGVVVSAAFGEEPLQQQLDHSQDGPAVAGAHMGYPPAAAPSIARSGSRRRQQPPRIHALVRKVRKAPPLAP